MTIICSNKSCKYRKAVFCGRAFVGINQFGQCLVWFDKEGRLRAVPNYKDDIEEKKETPPGNFEKPAEGSKNIESEIENEANNNDTKE